MRQFNTVDEFTASVNHKTDANGINHMVKSLRGGATALVGIHPFEYGSDEYKQAFNSIFKRAGKLGLVYDKKNRHEPFRKPNLIL